MPFWGAERPWVFSPIKGWTWRREAASIPWGLDAEDDHVPIGPACCRSPDDTGMRLEIAVRAEDSQPSLPASPEDAGRGAEQCNVRNRREPRAGAKISSDGAGPGDSKKLHCPPASALATAPRWICRSAGCAEWSRLRKASWGILKIGETFFTRRARDGGFGVAASFKLRSPPATLPPPTMG